jgi:hypothetical protein
MFRDISRGNSADTVTPIHTTQDEFNLPARMREHVQKLKIILPVISVSVMALRRQNAELDEDIAAVLHQHAIDPLDLEIEDLEKILEVLAARRRKEVVA